MLKPWRVVAGIAIIIGTIFFSVPVVLAMQDIPVVLSLYLAGLGIGIWITIFAMKDISFVTFKKEHADAASPDRQADG